MRSDDRDYFDPILALPSLSGLLDVFRKHKSVFLYVLFGGLTTFVSIGSFVLFDSVLHIPLLVANLLSWICAVTFAYITNRIWVFSSQARGAAIVKEALSFYAGRVFTLVLEEACLVVFVTMLHFDSTLIKFLAQILVLILNYVISKVFVFRKKA